MGTVARTAALALSMLFLVGAGREAKPVLSPPVPGPPVVTYDRDVEERKTIRLVQRASAHAIDSLVADIPFADWFRGVVGPNAIVSWEAEDCGKTERPSADFEIHHPLPCARASADLGEGLRIYALIGLVSSRMGEAKHPVFLDGGVTGPEDRQPTKVGFLADLQEWSRHHRGITGFPHRN
jgi:hypothetical protein